MSERQPERKTGNALMSACFSSGDWSCLMHALSSHNSGESIPSSRFASSPHASSCLNFAAPSSCQLCEQKPFTAPRTAGAVFEYRPVSSFDTRSDCCSSARGSARKRAFASASALAAEPPPTSADIVEASASLVLLLPIEAKRACARPRLRGVAMTAMIRDRTPPTTKNG